MDLRKYNCLVKVYYKDGYISWHGFVIHARDKDEAEEDIIDMLQGWNNTESYELQEISKTNYFRVLPFLISARIQFKTQLKSVKFKLRAPDVEKAKQTAEEVISSWKDVKNYEIENVYETDRKPVSDYH